MKIIEREVDVNVLNTLRDKSQPEAISRVMARIFAGRGARKYAEAYPGFKELLPYTSLKGCLEAARYLRDLVVSQNKQQVVVLADYDTDGATACAVMLYTLRHYGLQVDFMVPDRQVEGYGLTPAIVNRIHDTYKPTLIITVDNGISSIEGVARAAKLGIEVIVTDHHLPGPEMPKAKAIVNPNQPGCKFVNKSIAGCGVAWYVMWALESLMTSAIQQENARVTQCIQDVLANPELSMEEKFQRKLALGQSIAPWARASEFAVKELLPFVAIGTIADVVSLKSHHNRVLAKLGIDRIRQAPTYPGIEALFQETEHTPRLASAFDIGFGVAPRINAAGRLKDMTLGIRCLTADNTTQAKVLARDLTKTNRQRKKIERDIMEDAWESMLDPQQVPLNAKGVVMYHPDAHQGVVGIVAGRVKELFWVPVFVIGETAEDGYAKASGRSIPGFHLKHCLDDLQAIHPGLFAKYGGHAMAAGLSILPENVPTFQRLFKEYTDSHVTPEMQRQVLYTDGSISFDDITPQLIDTMKKQPWGQDFPAPTFDGVFQVKSAKAIADGSISELVLTQDGKDLTFRMYRHVGSLPTGTIRAAYTLELDSYRNIEKPYGVLQYFEQVS